MKSSYVLQNIEYNIIPFQYFLANKAFDEKTANNLLNWLKNNISWKIHIGDFFEQWEYNLSESKSSKEYDILLAPETLAKIKETMRTIFGKEFHDKVKISAHKLMAGQGIGIHNDDPQDGNETHRLIVHLNDDFNDSDGGHLVFFNSNNPRDIHRIFRPLHNTAIGIEFSQKSYHAVSDVTKNNRYTIIYSFWSKLQNEPTIKELENSLSEKKIIYKKDSIQDLVSFLEDIGTQKIKHSNINLMSHLINTYKILVRWKCRPYLAKAGLFHSIYGTEAFNQQVVSKENRILLKEKIGSRSEKIAFLYSTLSRESLYENLFHNKSYKLSNFGNNNEITISKQVLSDLMTLDLANSIEQFSRISLSIEQMNEEKEMYERARHLIPHIALQEMRSLYAQNSR